MNDLCRGQVSFWSFAKTLENNYIGSITANCTDGSTLPTVSYAYNSSSNSSTDLTNHTAVSNQGYRLLGNFSYRYVSCFISSSWRRLLLTRYLNAIFGNFAGNIYGLKLSLPMKTGHLVKIKMHALCISQAYLEDVRLWCYVTDSLMLWSQIDSAKMKVNSMSRPSHFTVLCSSGEVLESFLDFRENDTFFSCGQFFAPIGFTADSNCLGITSFQVVHYSLSEWLLPIVLLLLMSTGQLPLLATAKLTS